MSFPDQLARASASAGSRLCIALDVMVADTPLPILPFDEPMLPFAREIVDATLDLVCAFQLNPAFYLCEGAAGMVALERIARLIPPGIPLIWNARHACLVHEAPLLARAAFRQFGAAAVTLAQGCPTDAFAAEGGVFVACGPGDRADLVQHGPAGEPQTGYALLDSRLSVSIAAVGRPVLYASKRLTFAEDARAAAQAWRAKLNAHGG